MQRMESYSRRYTEFSLCGLNCALCPRYHTDGPSRCPGCGGNRFSELHPACPIIRYSRKHGNIEYCQECDSYPCERYRDEAGYDSFITYVVRLADQERVKQLGIEAYQRTLNQKERTALMVALMTKQAENQHIELHLRRKGKENYS